MASNDTYSTTAVDGSADEFGPSPSIQTPKTPAQLAADKALAIQRIDTFMSDHSLPTIITRSRRDADNTIAARRHAAAVNMAAFDETFDKYNTDGGKLKGNE